MPENLFQALRAASPTGVIYQREDEDVVTFSSNRMTDGRRRKLHSAYRFLKFREATQLVIVDMKDSIQIMASAWRKRRPAASLEAD